MAASLNWWEDEEQLALQEAQISGESTEPQVEEPRPTDASLSLAAPVAAPVLTPQRQTPAADLSADLNWWEDEEQIDAASRELDELGVITVPAGSMRPDIDRGLVGEGVAGAQRGMAQTAGMLYGFTGMLAEGLGMEPTAEWANKKALEKLEDAQQFAASIEDPYEEIEDASDTLKFAVGAMTQFIPDAAVSLLAGGLGGLGARAAVGSAVKSAVQGTLAKRLATNLVTRQVERQVATGATRAAAEKAVADQVTKRFLKQGLGDDMIKRSALGGAYAVNYAQNAGEISTGILQQTGETSPGIAALAAAPNAALDTIFDAVVGGPILGKLVPGARAPRIAPGTALADITVGPQTRLGRLGQTAQTMATTGLVGGVVEGVTEGAQTFGEQIARGLADPRTTPLEAISSEEAAREREIAAAYGFAGGLGLGAAGGVAQSQFTQRTQRALQTKLRMDQAEAQVRAAEQERLTKLGEGWDDPVDIGNGVLVARRNDGSFAAFNLPEDQAQGLQPAVLPNGQKIHIFVDDFELGLSPGNAASSLANLARQAYGKRAPVVGGQAEFDFMAGLPKDEGDGDYNPPADAEGATPPGGTPPGPGDGQGELDFTTPPPVGPAPQNISSPGTSGQRSGPVAAGSVISPTQDGPAAPPAGPAPAPAGPTPSGPAPAAPSVKSELDPETRDTKQAARAKETLKRPAETAAPFVEGLNKGDRVSVVMPNPRNRKTTLVPGIFAERLEDGDSIFQLEDGQTVQIPKTQSNRVSMLRPEDVKPAKPVAKVIKDQLGPAPTKAKIEQTFGVSNYTPGQTLKQTIADGNGDSPIPVLARLLKKKGTENDYLVENEGEFTNDPLTSVRQMNAGLPIYLPENQDLNLLSPDIEVTPVDLNGVARNKVSAVNLWGRTYRQGAETSDFSVSRGPESGLSENQTRGLGIFNSIYRLSPERLRRSAAGMQAARTRQQGTRMKPEEMNKGLENLDPVDRLILDDSATRAINYINRKSSTKGQATTEDVQDAARFAATDDIMTGLVKAAAARNEKLPATSAPVARRVLNNFNEILGQPLPAGEERDAKSDAKKAGDLVVGELQNEGMAEAEARAAVDPIVRRLATVQSPISIAEAALKSATKTTIRREANRAAATADLQEGTVGETPTVKKPRKSARPLNAKESAKVETMTQRRDRLSEEDLDLITADISGEELTGIDAARVEQIKEYLDGNSEYETLYPQRPDNADAARGQTSGRTVSGPTESRARGSSGGRKKGRAVGVGRANDGESGTVPGAAAQQAGGSGVRDTAGLTPAEQRSRALGARRFLIERFLRLTGAEIAAATEAQINRVYEAITTILSPDAANQGRRVVAFTEGQQVADLANTRPEDLLAAVGAERIEGQKGRKRAEMVRRLAAEMFRAGAFDSTVSLLEFIANNKSLPRDMQLRAKAALGLQTRGFNWANIATQIGIFRNMDGSRTTWAGLLGKDRDGGKSIAINLDNGHDRGTAYQTFLHEIQHVLNDAKWDAYYGLPGGQGLKLNKVELAAIKRIEDFWKRAVLTAAKQFGIDTPANPTDAEFTQLGEQIYELSDPTRKDIRPDRRLAALRNPRELSVEITSSPETAELLAELGFGKADKEGRVAIKGAVKEAWDALVQLESGTIADPDSPLAMAFKASMAINFAGAGDKKVNARYTVPDSAPSRLTRELDEMRTASDFVEAELEARGLPGTSEQRARIVREYELTRREPTQEDLDEIADPETMSRAMDPSDLIQIGMRVRVTARDANGTRFNFFARPGTGSTMLGAPVRVFQETDKDGATVNRTRVVQADLIENEQPLAMSKTYGEWVPVPSTSLESRAIVDSWQRAVDQNRLGAVEFERLTADEIPQSTQEVYKLVVLQPTKPMQAQSLFDRPENAPKKAFPVGEWIRAEVGRPMISGPLAMRPGFHAIGLPIFDQGRVQAKGQMRVWASVTMPAFTDSTQQEADSSPILANGMRQGIKDRLIGPDEAYNYKTNPNAEEGGTWPISGSMKINRFLTNTEITEILTGAAKEGAVANNISNFTDDQIEQINRMVVRATESRATTPQENLNTTPQMVSNRRQANEITSRATADGPGNLEPRRQTGDRGMGPDDAGRADRPGRPQLRADAYLAWLGEQARTSPDLLRNPQRAMLAWGEAAGLIQTPKQVRSRTTGSRDQGAFEHHVYDTVDGKILKVLKPGRGYSYDPLEYLVRLSRLQTAVPDLDIDVTGMLSVNRSPRFVTEMARIAGEHPDAAFLSDKLAEYGWADTGNFTYLHRSGVSMTDAAPDNFIRVGDDVVPFDVIFEGDVSQPMFVPSQEQVAESRAVSETLPPVPTDPMPMSAVDVLYRDSAVLPKPAKKIKNAEVATILADIAQRYWGFQLNSENITPEIEQIIVANGVEEFISALRASGKNAADWYSTAIEVAMEVAGVIHPEITNAELARGIPAFSSAAAPDKAAQLVMRIALAVTSQNLNVNQNAGYAEEQYGIFRRTGKFDSLKIYGEKAESISGNLELANQLIAKLGFEGAEAFIQKEFSVDTLQKEASAVLGRRVKIAGKKDDIVNGAALFGPKIGQGFLQNLMGRFNPVTIDLWMRRTWGRWTGDVVGDGVTDERMAKLLDAAREDGLQIPESLRSLRTVERKRKNGESYKTMSSTVADRLETDPDFRSSVEKFAAEFNSRGQAEYRFTGQPVSPRVAASVAAGNIPYKQFIRDQQRVRDGLDRTWDRLRKEGKKPAMSKASWVAEQHRQEGRTEVLDRKVRSGLKPKWSRSAKVIIGNLNPIDIPSPQDRRVITRIVNKIREDLSNRGYSATNADVQAVLWYPEKDLWAKLRGEEESNLKLSYDDEFISIAEERGLGEQARAVASRIRADRAARTGGQDDAGTDRGVARPADASPATDQRVESRAVTEQDSAYIAAADRGDLQAAREIFELEARAAARPYPNRSYATAPNALMGFSENGRPQKGYDDFNYTKEVTVLVRFPDGRSIVDGMNGINVPHAMERARRNWEGAEIDLVAEGPSDLVIFDAEDNIVPLSERFVTTTESRAVSPQQDTDYLAAVERGDMETAQRMVDEAADRSGYGIESFHGTNGDLFTVFDLDIGGDKTGADSATMGVFSTDNPNVAQSYADNMGMGGAFGLALGAGELSEIRSAAFATPEGKRLAKIVEDTKATLTAAFASAWEKRKEAARIRIEEVRRQTPQVFDSIDDETFNAIVESAANRSFVDNQDANKDAEIVEAQTAVNDAEKALSDYIMPQIIEALPNRRVMRLRLQILNPKMYDAQGQTPASFALSDKIQSAKESGNDGVIFQNIIDPVESATHYVVFSPEQIKSADAVTRDDQGNVIPLSQRFNEASPDIRESRAVADPDDEGLAAAEVLNNGRPVDTYGLPRGERASDTTPEGDLDVADAQIDSTTRSLVKLVGAFESATDKLRRGTGLTKLADYIDNYFDLYEQRLGLANGLLRRARVKMGMGSDEEAVRTFESYMRARENKRAAEAKQIYDQSTEAQRAYIDAWDDYSKQTGVINIQIRTPDGKPMQVYDTKLKKWRPIQTVRDFFPRTMRQEVQAVLQNPALDPALYNDLLDSLVAGKKAESREQAQEYLKREYFGTDTSQDYFAGVERGRREPLPEIFYDYSVDAIRRYMKKWAQRTAQIEAFGQATSQGTGDWFDNNITKVRDQNTRRYLNQIKERIYEVKEDDAFGSLMNWLNVGATGLQLGNPATAFINLFGGSGLTVTEYGWKNTIKAAKDVFSDWKNVMQSGADLGIVGKDLLNVLNDADMEGSKYFTEQSTVSQALAKFASFTMKWGGYSGAENFVRATTMLAARGKLMEGLRANNTNPSSSKARWVFDFAKRENLDANKLVMENGAGPETGKFLRKAVNVPQGSYRIDMTPIYVDQPLGRFLFKYQKFGTQLTRMFWRHHLQPFIEKPDLANFSRLLHFFSAAIVSGTVIVAGRAALFGYPDPGPDEEDLKRALANKDTARAWGLIFSRAWHSMNAAGALGFFGNYFQFVLDWRDQQRVKNPLKPPGLASIDAVVEVLSRLREQGKLTGKDLDEIAESTIALYRANKRIGLSSLDAVGIEFNQVKEWAAEKQIRRMRKYSRMYADDREIEGRQRSPDGRISKTPMSPLNRDITLALRRGDAGQAKLIMDTALKGAATKEEREAMMASIQSSVRFRQPLSISGRPPSSEERADFFNWARRNAPPHRYESMRKMDEEYRRAAARLGVSIK